MKRMNLHQKYVLCVVLWIAAFVAEVSLGWIAFGAYVYHGMIFADVVPVMFIGFTGLYVTKQALGFKVD